MTDIIYPPGAAPVDGVTTTLATVVQLTAETTRATGAETTLTNGLAAEASTARAAELTNATGIASETSRATAAEGALLPLAGGTLTGALAGTSFAFTGAGTVGGTLGVTGALTGTTATLAGGTQTVTVDVTPALNWSRGLAGTAVNNPSFVYSAARLVVSPDSLAVSTVNQFVNGLQLQHNYGSTTAMTGNRQAMQVNLVQAGTTGNTIASGHTGFYTALQTYSQASFNDNGTGLTSTTAHGRTFGAAFAAQLNTGATNFFQCTGMEINAQIQTGASAAIKNYISIAANGSSNVTQGTLVDTGIWFYKSGGVAMKSAILIGGGGSGLNNYPIDPAGAYFADDTSGSTTASCAYGIHWTGAFTTAAISVPGFVGGDASGFSTFTGASGGTIGIQPGTTNGVIDAGAANLVIKSGTSGTGGLVNVFPTLQAPSLVLNKAAVTTGAVIGIKQGIALTGSSSTSPASVNLFSMSSDVVAAPNGLNVINIAHQFGGSGLTGSRNSLAVTSTFTAQSGNASGSGYGPAQFTMTANAADHGTATTAGNAHGNLFGFNTVAHFGASATNWAAICGYELDLYLESGASVMDKVGQQIVLLNLDVVQGARDDQALSFNNQYTQAAGTGWKTLIGVGRQGGFPGLDPTSGWILQCIPNLGVGSVAGAGGLDFTNFVPVTAFMQGNNFLLDPSGNFKANTFKVGSNQVVGARDTGWAAMTGSPDKATAYATGSVTLAQLAGRVAQLQASLTAHGLIGA